MFSLLLASCNKSYTLSGCYDAPEVAEHVEGRRSAKTVAFGANENKTSSVTLKTCHWQARPQEVMLARVCWGVTTCLRITVVGRLTRQRAWRTSMDR